MKIKEYFEKIWQLLTSSENNESYFHYSFTGTMIIRLLIPFGFLLLFPLVFLVTLSIDIIVLVVCIFSLLKSIIKSDKILSNWAKEVYEDNDNHYLSLMDENRKVVTFPSDDYKSFIESFCTDYSYRYDTGVTKEDYTYLTCRKGKRRSLGDIYLITKYYFPKVTIHQVLRKLCNLIKKRKIGVMYCNTINKTVFYNDYAVRKMEHHTEYSHYPFSLFYKIYK